MVKLRLVFCALMSAKIDLYLFLRKVWLMDLEFDVQMDKSILFDYSLYHTYMGISGLLGTFVGILLLISFTRDHSPLYLIFGIVVILYLPVNLYLACSKQILAVEAYKHPLHYKVNDEGITVSQGEQVVSHGWDRIIKAVSTRKSIILYTGKNVATIFPRSAMGELTVPVIQTISANVEPKKVKIRF